MARQTWDLIKQEAILELKSRTDIDTRVENWLREAYLEVAYGYRFHDLETSVIFSLGNDDEMSFEHMGAQDLKFVLTLRDMTNKRKVLPATFKYIDTLGDNIDVPRHYCRFAKSLLFDGTPSTSIQYRLRYKRQIHEPIFAGTPIKPVNSPDTPDEWDEVIRLLAVARGFEAMFEPDNATRVETRAARLIARLPTEEQVDADDDVANLTVRTS